MRKANDIRDIVHDGVRPDRAAESLKVVETPAGGFTTYKRKRVQTIGAPMRKDNARARTIRIHELLHANNTPMTQSKRWSPWAINAIEDARVHSVYWPNRMPHQANRDCMATALTDMRTIPPMAELGRAEDWNRNLLVALRSMAILNRLYASNARDKHLARLQDRMVNAFGPIVAEKLEEVFSNVAKHKTKALRQFCALLRDEDEEQPRGGNDKGQGSHGKPRANPMRIVRLPMTHSCNSAVRRTSFARSGARLNRARLARSVVTGSTAGLFVRTRYLRGGAFLIDGSGSMQMSAARLNEICKSVPAATVAYYSGWGAEDSSGCFGELVIYAANGRRADYCERVHGGNEIDLFALRWLLTQPAPRVFVSDGGFCGGPAAQDAQCAALLAMAVATGQVQWLRSIYELESQLS